MSDSVAESLLDLKRGYEEAPECVESCIKRAKKTDWWSEKKSVETADQEAEQGHVSTEAASFSSNYTGQGSDVSKTQNRNPVKFVLVKHRECERSLQVHVETTAEYVKYSLKFE